MFTIVFTAGTVAIGTAIVLANAGMTWISGINARKRQKAQHEYEEKVLQEGHLAAMQQFQELCNVKKEIAEDEFKRNMELLKQQQKQSLRDVGYFSSLDEWPLQIPPMVMRNDNLFLNCNDEDMFSNIVSQVEPVHIIIIPCRDMNFRNSFHVKIEKKLSSFFEEYWGPSTMHPVIYYKQCWKDKTHDADGITVKNLHVKISTIPTIIINPVINKNSLRFETSFWNIFGDNREGKTESIVSVPIMFPKDVYPFKSGLGYSERDQELLSNEISSFLMSMLSMLVDQYYWRRYHISPNQTKVILRKGLSYSKAEIDSLTESYTSTLQNSMDIAEICPITETDEVMNFCRNVDSLNNGNSCFKTVLLKLSKKKNGSIEDLLVSLPFYGCDFHEKLLDYCKQNKDFYNISSSVINKLELKFVRHLMWEETQKKLNETDNGLPYNAKDAMSTEAYKEINNYIIKRHEKCWNRCDNDAKAIINKSRAFKDKTDKRNWARPRIKKSIRDIFFNELKATIVKNEHNIMDAKEECIVSFIENIVMDNSLRLNVSDHIINQASDFVKRLLKRKYIKPLDWNYNNSDIFNPYFEWFANTVVKNRIEYRFLGVDVVRNDSELSQESKRNMKRSYGSNIWSKLKTEIEKELIIIFGGSTKEAVQYSEEHYYSSPSEPEWDPHTETFGIY